MRSLVPLSLAALAVAGSTWLAPSAWSARVRHVTGDLPLIGTNGGHAFTQDCPAGHVLTGFRWRTGAVVDGLGIRCSKVLPNGTLGPESDVGPMYGGNGGTAGHDSCHGDVMIGQNGATAGVGLASLTFACVVWYPASRSWGGGLDHTITVRQSALFSLSKSDCGVGTTPATGIRGRHGSFIDAVGLRCSTP